ncbi:Transmembrane domain-containing protein [Spironucleus salmonicida]|uniref:Transmembrane domain-containing protein n=1 Tax=Spironucleus salmonicida TaxID=348837 RepID=A0A9P8LX07_9EUKA|nr:Transmembrane domain-containing protein [Spironucleus salmonicida]
MTKIESIRFYENINKIYNLKESLLKKIIKYGKNRLISLSILLSFIGWIFESEITFYSPNFNNFISLLVYYPINFMIQLQFKYNDDTKIKDQFLLQDKIKTQNTVHKKTKNKTKISYIYKIFQQIYDQNLVLAYNKGQYQFKLLNQVQQNDILVLQESDILYFDGVVLPNDIVNQNERMTNQLNSIQYIKLQPSLNKICQVFSLSYQQKVKLGCYIIYQNQQLYAGQKIFSIGNALNQNSIVSQALINYLQHLNYFPYDQLAFTLQEHLQEIQLLYNRTFLFKVQQINDDCLIYQCKGTYQKTSIKKNQYLSLFQFSDNIVNILNNIKYFQIFIILLSILPHFGRVLFIKNYSQQLITSVNFWSSFLIHGVIPVICSYLSLIFTLFYLLDKSQAFYPLYQSSKKYLTLLRKKSIFIPTFKSLTSIGFTNTIIMDINYLLSPELQISQIAVGLKYDKVFSIQKIFAMQYYLQKDQSAQSQIFKDVRLVQQIIALTHKDISQHLLQSNKNYNFKNLLLQNKDQLFYSQNIRAQQILYCSDLDIMLFNCSINEQCFIIIVSINFNKICSIANKSIGSETLNNIGINNVKLIDNVISYSEYNKKQGKQYIKQINSQFQSLYFAVIPNQVIAQNSIQNKVDLQSYGPVIYLFSCNFILKSTNLGKQFFNYIEKPSFNMNIVLTTGKSSTQQKQLEKIFNRKFNLQNNPLFQNNYLTQLDNLLDILKNHDKVCGIYLIFKQDSFNVAKKLYCQGIKVAWIDTIDCNYIQNDIFQDAMLFCEQNKIIEQRQDQDFLIVSKNGICPISFKLKNINISYCFIFAQDYILSFLDLCQEVPYFLMTLQSVFINSIYSKLLLSILMLVITVYVFIFEFTNSIYQINNCIYLLKLAPKALFYPPVSIGILLIFQVFYLQILLPYVIWIPPIVRNSNNNKYIGNRDLILADLIKFFPYNIQTQQLKQQIILMILSIVITLVPGLYFYSIQGQGSSLYISNQLIQLSPFIQLILCNFYSSYTISAFLVAYKYPIQQIWGLKLPASVQLKKILIFISLQLLALCFIFWIPISESGVFEIILGFNTAWMSSIFNTCLLVSFCISCMITLFIITKQFILISA